jgi:hypothetical protein
VFYRPESVNPGVKHMGRPELRKVRSECPARDHCGHPHPKQMDLNPALLEREGVSGDWVSRAKRCTYCGTVYSVEPGGKIIRGYYDSMLGPNWRPASERAPDC